MPAKGWGRRCLARPPRGAAWELRPLRLVGSRTTFLVAILALLLVGQPYAGRAEESCALLPEAPLPFPLPDASLAVPSNFDQPGSGSHVALTGNAFAYDYRVDGHSEVVRGMGYNPRYDNLDAAQRRTLYQRDFASMAAAGVNTVFGWDPAQFDGLTLDLAYDHGLGVALPYDFDWRLDLADPSVGSAVKRDILDWVARYREHPAVRMWAIGNETLHKLVPPSWCADPPTADQEARASAFGSFYADLIDAIRALDPDHPVLYREAEDSYVEWIRAALTPRGPRPWFIYGLNLYTARLPEVLEHWPGFGLDSAVLVSEFAPGPEDRPQGYMDHWASIRSHPNRVIGGAIYVWFAEGPEDVDRIYGLVDPEGRPVDGSLDLIRRLFRAEAV